MCQFSDVVLIGMKEKKNIHDAEDSFLTILVHMGKTIFMQRNNFSTREKK